MAKKLKDQIKEGLTVLEAIENLTTIAEMVIGVKTPLGILQSSEMHDEDFSYKEIFWLVPEDPNGFVLHIKPSFDVLLNHLQSIYNNNQTDWDDKELKKSLQSIMSLVADAVSKLNQYFSSFNKDIDFTKNKGFVDLQTYYLNYISKKYPEGLEGKEAWNLEWEGNSKGKVLDYDESSIKDFDAIKEDVEYELFYMKNMEGESFFSSDLIKNIKIFTYLDEKVQISDDIFFRIQKLKNKDMNLSASQILHFLDKDIHEFYKSKFDRKNNKLAKFLNKSFMALMLAANPKNLMRSNGKSCNLYFKDFILFLRNGVSTEEYQISSDEKTKKDDFLNRLANKTSFTFFSRFGGIKKEVIGYIHRMVRRGKTEEKLKEGSGFYNELIQKDDNFRSYLKKYPNGAMIKLINDLERMGEEEFCFDPIMQDNLPESLFEVKVSGSSINVLHLPCPTSQEVIDKAEILPEFKAFLRELKDKNENYLLFNFQNRECLRENSRAKAIEEIQKTAEFNSAITVITLPKHSDFYNQVENFTFRTSSTLFMKDLKEMVFQEKEGFFIPLHLKNEKLENFVEEISSLIHKVFFLEKEDLSKEERRTFIEIFYHFFILKIIEMINPSYLSFTCKDAVDIGSSATGSFFLFIKLLTSSKWIKEDEDFLLWLFYAPALIVRQRAISSERLVRQLSCLALLDTKKKGLRKEMKNLYGAKFLDSIKINYLH
jgi:hypothetical protein